MKTKLSIAVLAATLSASAFAAQDSETVEAVEATTETVTGGVALIPGIGAPGATTVDGVVDTALDTSIREVPTVFGRDEVGEELDPTAGTPVSMENPPSENSGLTEEGLGGVSISEGVDQALFIVSSEILMDDQDSLDSNLDDIVNSVDGIIGAVIDARNVEDGAVVVGSITDAIDGTRTDVNQIVDGTAGAFAPDNVDLTDPQVPGTGQDQNQDIPGTEEPAPAPAQTINPGQVDIDIEGSVVTLPDGCGLTTNEVTFTFSEIAQTDTVDSYKSSSATVSIANCEDATISMSTTNSQTDKDRTVALAFEAAGSTEGFVNVDEETFSAELVAADENSDPFNVPVSTDDSGNLDVELAATVNGDDARENVGSFKAQDEEHIFVFIDGKETASES